MRTQKTAELDSKSRGNDSRKSEILELPPLLVFPSSGRTSIWPAVRALDKSFQRPGDLFRWRTPRLYAIKAAIMILFPFA
jgi:hypothetical protein